MTTALSFFVSGEWYYFLITLIIQTKTLGRNLKIIVLQKRPTFKLKAKLLNKEIINKN